MAIALAAIFWSDRDAVAQIVRSDVAHLRFKNSGEAVQFGGSAKCLLERTM